MWHKARKFGSLTPPPTRILEIRLGTVGIYHKEIAVIYMK